MSYQEFMTLSDEDIWSGSNRFGNCAIVDQRTASGSCDYYIKKNDITG